MKTMTQQQVDEWNAQWPVGSRCWVRRDDGVEEPRRTRSEAWLLHSGHAVIKVDGIAGGFALNRLRMVHSA